MTELQELEAALAEVLTPGEIVDRKLFARAVLADLRGRGYDVVKKDVGNR